MNVRAGLFRVLMAVTQATFLGTLVLVTPAGAPPALAAHDVGLFELDGNAVDEAAAGADWENGAEGAADAFFVGAADEAAANDDTYFQTGGSKDENDIPSWVIANSSGGAPDKNELTDAYAAVYQSGGDTWVYFGADRFDNDGTAQIGFWFFQDGAVGVANGDFTGNHVDGDVLIISEYTNGGVVSTICAYTWDGSGGGANIDTDVECDPATDGSNLNLVAAGVDCDVADGTYDICAVSNDAVADAPWSFTNKDGAHDFAKGQFFEGGLNLSDMFGGDAPCFGGFLAETRTSAETDAQLKDFAFGDFNTCVPPTITTQSSTSTADFGQSVTDTANLSGSSGAVTGSVDFYICEPDEVTAGGCEGDAGTKVGATKTISSGSATSDAYTIGTTAAAAGTYCWRAEYTPNAGANYVAGSHTNAGSECFTVAPATVSITKTANPAGPVTVGGEVGFDITVSNTGTTTTLGITVTDNLPAGIVWTADAPTGNTTGVSCAINTAPNPDVLTCTDPSLPAGQSWTVHIHGTTDAGDCGTVSNSASVTTTNDGSDSDNDSVEVACPALNIEKSSTTTQITAAGQVVPYTFILTNTGNVTLTQITVTDPNCDSGPTYQSGDTNGDSKLQVTETWTYTCNHTVTQAEIDTNGGGDGDLDNTVTADSAETGPDTDDLAIPIVLSPSLSIVKTDGDATFDSVGDVIVYNIRVTNTGNVTLLNVLVTDQNAPNVDCSAAAGQQTTIPSLAPGAFVDCSASHTIVQADLDAGTYLNTACADDGNGDGTTGADPVCDDEDTPGEQSPELSIDKVDNTGTYDEVGDVIDYTITVTNTGNVTLHDVVVTDAQVSDLDCTPDTPVADLAPGATITCTASHTIVQADLDAGSFWNQACADDENGAAETGAAAVCDDVTTTGEQNPSLSIDKVDNTGSFDSVGDVISYTITATNDGNVTLHDVIVTDAQVSDLDCTPDTPVADLAPGASITCTASHTITQADLDAGSFWNQACTDDENGAADTGADAVCDDVTTPGSKNPSLTITKVATESGFDEVGDVIHYTITATNNGNVTLHNVVVTDAQVTDLDCTPDTPVADLAPGASITCTASHTIVQADLDEGSFYNQACVDDGDGGAASACDDVDTPGDQNPSLAITKDATETGFDSVGDVIHYSITATNDGNVTLHDVVVTDAQVTDLDCTPETPVADLAPGESITCTASHTITQEDLDAGSFYNQACTDDGNGNGESGAAAVCDDVDTPGDQNPSLAITKVATESGFDSVGDVIHYTITATNDGNVTLHDVLVTDPMVSDLDCTPDNPVTDLAPGASITCTASHTVTQADLDAGHFFNQACVDDGQGPAEVDCDDVDTPGDQNPVLGIDKSAAEADYDQVGDVIHYTILVTNIGNVTLHDVVVTDLQVTDLDCDAGTEGAQTSGFTLGVLETLTCTATHTVTAQDLDVGFYFNEACADDDDGALESGAAPVCDDVTVFGEEVQDFTPNPTEPPTDTLGRGAPSTPADGWWLLVALLGGLLAAVVVLTPTRGRRRT